MKSFSSYVAAAGLLAMALPASTGGAAFVKSTANGTSIAGMPCGTFGEWAFYQNW